MLRALLFCCALLLAAQGQTAVTLKIATLVPDGTGWMKTMRAAGKEIQARTQERVKLRFYPGGVMGNDNSVLRKIRAGQLHGGALTAGGLSALYPDIQIYSLPFLFQSLDEVDYVRKRMDSKIIQGLKEKGFACYGLNEGGFVYVMSQAPISSVDHLKKRKVWAPEGDPLSQIAFNSLGVTPIPLPLTDVLTGLQTGLIDTIGAAPVAAIALQWHTRINYLTDAPIMYLYGALVLRERALKKLSSADRQILREVMEKTIREISAQTRRGNQSALQALKKQDITFVSPSSRELAEWKQIFKQSVDEMARKQAFSPALYNEIRAQLTDYRTQQGK